MKLLVVASTLNLENRMGCTPDWWGLLKGLHECGHEVIAMSYLGKSIESSWWRTYPNPCQWESETYNKFLNATETREVGEYGFTTVISDLAVKLHVTPKWTETLIDICKNEKPIDAVLFMSVPLQHIKGIAKELRDKFQMPVLYYDGDLPMSLPEYSKEGAFKFSMYHNADISEYDVFLSCSKGTLPRLIELGAKKAEHLYYAVDPSVFSPVESEQDIDVFYYGHRSRGKEVRIDYMIKEPMMIMPDILFAIAGQEYATDGFDRVKFLPRMALNTWRSYCNRSKINLNITKDIDANIPSSSSGRPFILAGMGCCVVSDDYSGIEAWFEPEKEIVVCKNALDAVSAYKELLITHPARRMQIGKAARKRVLAEHTWKHRAERLTEIIKSV